LIVGSGNLAVELAREVLNRPDAGYRIIGFVGNDAELLGKSLINPRVIGLTEQLDEIVKRENIDRIVVAMGERRGQLPTNKLLQLSLAGQVTIEEGQSFYERVTGRVSLNMLQSRGVRREETVDGHVPDPIVTLTDPGSLAGLLNPQERDGLLAAVWLLVSDKPAATPTVQLTLGPMAPAAVPTPARTITIPIVITTTGVARNRLYRGSL